MTKKLFIVFILLLFFLPACSKPVNTNSTEDTGMILFYGDGCPHCAKVEEYIKEHKITEKLNFSQLEVYNDKDNAQLLGEKAQLCNMPTDSIGVPLFWDRTKCIIGDQEIIKFFKQKLDEK
jgi:glutaredoxin